VEDVTESPRQAVYSDVCAGTAAEADRLRAATILH